MPPSSDNTPTTLPLRRKFPHLLSEDVPVWDAFLRLHSTDYLFFEYDVRMGLGRDPGPDFPDNLRNMALDLSMRRADVVAHKPNLIEVIEVTTHAGLTALGQVFAYPVMYRLTYMPHKPVIGHLVAQDFQTDIKPVFDTLNVHYTLVSPRTSPTAPP